jgi:hypothetical protein
METPQSRRAVLSDFLSDTNSMTNTFNFNTKCNVQEKIKSFRIQGDYGAKKFIKP